MFVVAMKLSVVYPIQMFTWKNLWHKSCESMEFQWGHVHDGYLVIETFYTPPFVCKVKTLSTYGTTNSLKPNIVARCFICCIRIWLCPFMPCLEMCFPLCQEESFPGGSSRNQNHCILFIEVESYHGPTNTKLAIVRSSTSFWVRLVLICTDHIGGQVEGFWIHSKIGAATQWSMLLRQK